MEETKAGRPPREGSAAETHRADRAIAARENRTLGSAERTREIPQPAWVGGLLGRGAAGGDSQLLDGAPETRSRPLPSTEATIDLTWLALEFRKRPARPGRHRGVAGIARPGGAGNGGCAIGVFPGRPGIVV